MVSLDVLRGYVLEEAVAKMLATCGYRLLTSHRDDPKALRKGKNGLLVRGRGADHQADALGELTVPTPFSLPTRLFVEAKFRRAKSGLDTVRNALGVLNDVNEYYPYRAAAHSLPPKRYHYRYSLFSTSGFTAGAQSFALAQQISLIDLSGPAFADVRAVVERAAAGFHALAVRRGVGATLPVRQVRGALRRALGTLDEDELSVLDEGPKPTRSRRSTVGGSAIETGDERPSLPAAEVQEIAEQMADDLNAVFVLAFPDAPFVIALRPYEVGAFNAVLDREDRVQEVGIGFKREGARQGSGEWEIWSSDAPNTPLAYFGLPPLVEAWLLAENEDQLEARRRVKQELLSTLTIYRGDKATQLRYVPLVRTTEQVSSYTETRTPLRRNYPSPLEVPRDRRTVQDSSGPPDIDSVYAHFADSPRWTADALKALLQRLDQQRPIQATVLREAAARDGVISRDRVYEIAGYDKSRSLRGFTRPIRRLSDELVDDGLLSENAPYPLAAWYPAPGPATWFTMPRHVVELMHFVSSAGR